MATVAIIGVTRRVPSHLNRLTTIKGVAMVIATS
jgi:hypothetical protein